MFVCCDCCVLSDRGHCDELITLPEESYRMWCVVECIPETLRIRSPLHALGRSATKKKLYLLPPDHLLPFLNKRKYAYVITVFVCVCPCPVFENVK